MKKKIRKYSTDPDTSPHTDRQLWIQNQHWNIGGAMFRYHLLCKILEPLTGLTDLSQCQISVGRSPDNQTALYNTALYLLLGKMSPQTGPRWSFTTAENISRFGTQIKLSRFGYFSTQKLYTSHQNFVIYMQTILALDWPLLVYIVCDILLGLFLYKYLFLKRQYSSIGPQIMTNFVKIGTKKSPQSRETDCSFDWLLILDTFARQSSSSSNHQTMDSKPQSRMAGFIYKLQFLKICLKK
jgi:hypothetical protein